jgi:hypothetical protein
MRLTVKLTIIIFAGLRNVRIFKLFATFTQNLPYDKHDLRRCTGKC